VAQGCGKKADGQKYVCKDHCGAYFHVHDGSKVAACKKCGVVKHAMHYPSNPKHPHCDTCRRQSDGSSTTETEDTNKEIVPASQDVADDGDDPVSQAKAELKDSGHYTLIEYANKVAADIDKKVARYRQWAQLAEETLNETNVTTNGAAETETKRAQRAMICAGVRDRKRKYEQIAKKMSEERVTIE